MLAAVEGVSSIVVGVVLVAVAVGGVLVVVAGTLSWNIMAHCSLYQALVLASMVY
jgi:hypothetical protein